MAVELDHVDNGAGSGAARLLLRAAKAESRSRDLLVASISDFLLPDDARLDERTRIAAFSLLAGVVGEIERVVTAQSIALLTERREMSLANALAAPAAKIVPRLIRSGLANDPELMGELLGRVRLETLAGALPFIAADADAPTLLNRLAARADFDVADAAKALLAAENRRRTISGRGSDLPAELHHRMVWWVIAIIREQHADIADAALDQALTDAAAHALGRHDEGIRVETCALRLAAALDARGLDLAGLLEQTITDRRAALFAALVGYACGLSYESARDFVLDPAGDRLWVALRAVDMPHDTIARIAVALAEADPRRDLEAFADDLDEIAALDPNVARASFAALRAPFEYRAALDALKRSL